jgi:Kef-type K+ transport system membrane component KefB
MPELSILPHVAVAGPLLAVGLLASAALAVGELFARWLRLPRIIGYAGVGLALGALGVIPPELRGDLRVAIDFCLGAVLFELAVRIDLGWLRRAPWLAALAAGETVGVALALYALFHLVLRLPPVDAACGAAIGLATSPAVVLWTTRDDNSQGQVTERAILLSAFGTAAAILALTLLLPLRVAAPETSPAALVAVALALAGQSIGLAAALAAASALLLQWAGRTRETQLAATFGIVALAAGTATALRLPVPLVLFAVGLGVRSIAGSRTAIPLGFGRTGELVYVLLFSLGGASLDFSAAGTLGLATAAFVVARAAAKAAVPLVFARVTRQPVRRAALLGIGLQPMSAVTVVIAQDALHPIAALGATVLPIVLWAAVILEVAGPLCARAALRIAGESAPAVV